MVQSPWVLRDGHLHKLSLFLGCSLTIPGSSQELIYGGFRQILQQYGTFLLKILTGLFVECLVKGVILGTMLAQ